MDFTCPHCDDTTPHRIEKYCPQCDKTLAHTAFHKNRSAPDNLSAWCKACRKQKRAEPEAKEAYNAYMRTWNDRHAEQVAANAREHYWERQEKRQEDPELDAHLRTLSRAKSRRAYKRDPEKAKAATDAWEAAHPEQINETRRKRYAKDPTKVKAQSAKRYALRRGAPINDLTAEDWEDLKRQYGYRCVYCGKKKPLTRDHITALINGGADTKQNVVPACRSCNGRKGKGPVLRPIQPTLL